MNISFDLKIEDFIKDVDDIGFFKTSSVSFGIQEKEGKSTKITPSGSSEISLVEVAEKQEFNIPNGNGRSFIRSTFDEKIDSYLKDMSKLSYKIISSKSKNDLKDGLKEIGDKAVKDIVNKIDKGIPPALSQKTIENKTRERGISITKPLVWTGQLKNSLKSKVKVKG